MIGARAPRRTARHAASTAARFDAATDRVSHTASSPPDPATAFAFTIWVYLAVDRNDFSTITRLHAASGATTRLTVATGGSGETPCLFSPANTGGVISPSPLVAGQWRALGVSCTDTTGTIYLASADLATVVSASGTVSGGSPPTGLTIGGRSPTDSSEWANTRLAFARVWTSTMTQPEMLAEWASRTPIRTSGLWAHWPLTSSTDLTDHSGNGHNLTAGSTSTTTEPGPPI